VGLTAELPAVADWHAEPAALSAYLDWLEKRGATDLVWTPEPAALPGVRKALAGRAFSLAVVLPNMSLYARDAMDAGPTGAVLKRFRALGPAGLTRLGLRLLPRVPGLLEKRFAAGILLLADAEFLSLSGLPVKRVLLHNSAADMALAFGCAELFSEFEAWARGRGVACGVLTSNLPLWNRRGISAIATEPAASLSWRDFRPRTPEDRLAAWKKRAGAL
jgi:hypothetical protein